MREEIQTSRAPHPRDHDFSSIVTPILPILTDGERRSGALRGTIPSWVLVTTCRLSTVNHDRVLLSPSEHRIYYATSQPHSPAEAGRSRH